ncbi:hypothetical protein LJR118_003798 [Acidovorax sp. LjRoot118]|uniref:hypothetical protein n=1 Tax=Acidovorax sp. LjRoot118 TaxID=3342256 RepID=UPI003ECC2A3F
MPKDYYCHVSPGTSLPLALVIERDTATTSPTDSRTSPAHRAAIRRSSPTNKDANIFVQEFVDGFHGNFHMEKVQKFDEMLAQFIFFSGFAETAERVLQGGTLQVHCNEGQIG